jgi:exodeoxyribonuclease VII small subunit
MSEDTVRPAAGESAAKPSPRAARKEPASFEDAVARLEKLVARMESGAEDLDAMVKSFEEGQALVKFCGEKLSAIERKVEILARKADGTVAAEPFGDLPPPADR